MSIMTIEITCRLPGYNAHEDKARANKYAAATDKKTWTNAVAWMAKAAQCRPIDGKVNVHIIWGLRWSTLDKRDPDNIYSAVKFVLDGLVLAGVLKNDTRRYVGSILHEYDESANKTLVHLVEAGQALHK
jgi:Holliday junction resolvase RusA-like endonuclease